MYYYDYSFPIGIMTIVSGDQGIVEVSLDHQVSNNQIKKETALIKKAYQQLSEYFVGTRQQFDLPLDLKGTQFQKECWQALQNIPYGQTRTYKEIAEAIGRPKAARAIGMANHVNPIMIIVPCHRVIGTNGKLTGYRGGLDVKEYLLDLEKRYRSI